MKIYVYLQDNTTFEKCLRYSIKWSELASEIDGTLEANESLPMEPCLDGYEYDTSIVVSSIVIDVRKLTVSQSLLENLLIRIFLHSAKRTKYL